MWTIERNAEVSYTVRHGPKHNSLESHDGYEMSFVVDNIGGGVAYLKGAVGSGGRGLPNMKQLGMLLKKEAFAWVEFDRVNGGDTRRVRIKL